MGVDGLSLFFISPNLNNPYVITTLSVRDASFPKHIENNVD